MGWFPYFDRGFPLADALGLLGRETGVAVVEARESPTASPRLQKSFALPEVPHFSKREPSVGRSEVAGLDFVSGVEPSRAGAPFQLQPVEADASEPR